MSGHTPGEWKAEQRNLVHVVTANDVTIAEVVAGTFQEEEANALLFAAAPDLLEACEVLIAYKQERGYLGAPFDALVAQAEEAVVKAKGSA